MELNKAQEQYIIKVINSSVDEVFKLELTDDEIILRFADNTIFKRLDRNKYTSQFTDDLKAKDALNCFIGQIMQIIKGLLFREV